MEGYNGTILAYGQRGNRKTFTMYGNDIENEISVCENSKENINFDIKISVMQIYKEVICDILTGSRDLKIKENPIKGIYVENLSEVYLINSEEFLNYNEIAKRIEK